MLQYNQTYECVYIYMIEEHERHFRDTESDYFSFFNYYLQACDLKKHHACSCRMPK